MQFDLPEKVDPRKVSTLFVQEMSRRGIHCGTNFKATLAHTPEDIAQTAAAAAEVFRIIKAGLDADNLDNLIEADLKKDPFRRQVR